MVRIKWSEFNKNQPVKIIIDLKTAELYIDNRFMLVQASFDFYQYGTREFELSVPYYIFKRQLMQLPLTEQMMFKDGKVKFKLTKLDKGNIKIEQVRKE